MTKSYREIDYRLRAAKNVERKMIVDALRRLTAFDHLASYRYVGFGSMPFVDFVLLHKTFGISSMVSIERQADDKTRFEFNKPLRCIELEFGEANAVLPDLGWQNRTIVWLDYEDELDSTILSDIEVVGANAPSGSALIVTVNAHPGDQAGRAGRVKEALGDELISETLTDNQLGGWKKASLYHKLIDDTIRAVTRNRSGGATLDERVAYHQVFHFRYQDGPRMVTVGGIFVSDPEREIFERCGFSNDTFYRDDNEAFVIDMPIITPRELLHIGSQLPSTDSEGINLDMIPEAEITKLARIYRYYPAFVEADI